MAELRYDQANYSKGEIDPKVYARVDYEGYYKSAKKIRNCIVIPQGGVQRRWGTTYVATLATATSPAYCEISTLIYDDLTTYLLVWEALTVKIYLENILVATAVTNYTQEDIANLRFAQVANRLIIANLYVEPTQLERSANASNAITGFTAGNNTLTLTSALTVNAIYPVEFTTVGSLPTTSPQIYVGRTYYFKMITTTHAQLYSTPSEAAQGLHAYTVSSAGASALAYVQNTWVVSNIPFSFFPAYDFNGGYGALTFTPSATSGSVTLTASGAIFSSALVEGLYHGGGGIMRITGYTDTTHVTGYTIEPFSSTSAVLGSLSFLGEPAWSTARGWPGTVSFFQQRLVFGGSLSIPNGVWLSVTNEAYNFDDSETLADNAIAWYPASGSISAVRSITSCRTLLIHTNTGNFSTPVATEQPVTPTNFTLTEQNKDGVGNIQPIFIDNQVIYIDKSGNNVKNMIWEITQSSYVLNNISVASSGLIVSPTDMASFSEPNFSDGSYVLLVNSDGSLAIFQTLHEQDISAWSLATTQTLITASNTDTALSTAVPSQFVKVSSAINDCWFVVQRSVPTAQGAKTISAISSVNNTLTVTGHGVAVGTSVLCTFTTSGALPTTVPALSTTQYFWVYAVDANTFAVFGNAADAAANVSRYTVSALGSNSHIVLWPLASILTVEYLDFNVYSDCARSQTSVGSATVSNLSFYNGQVVQVSADGVIYIPQTVFNGSIVLPNSVSNVTVGNQYISLFSPLPVNNLMADGNNFYKQKHIRSFYVNYYQTIGAQIQGYDIPTQDMQDVVLGQLATPVNGIYNIALMEGWDSFSYDIAITQSNPLPMTILGISYVLEV